MNRHPAADCAYPTTDYGAMGRRHWQVVTISLVSGVMRCLRPLPVQLTRSNQRPGRHRAAGHGAARWGDFPRQGTCRDYRAFVTSCPDSRSSQALPGLTRAAVRNLISGWNDGGLWDDVLFLADRFLEARSGEEEQVLRWHHLVMAVGNFKRQSGRRLRPPSPRGLTARSPVGRPERLVVPGRKESVELCVEDRATWEALRDELTGAAVATTTTLLAALWPERHFVFDRRVFAAANGLRIAGGLSGTNGVDPASTEPVPERTLDDYQLVRTWVLGSCSELGEPPVSVERALYELAKSIPGNRDSTWGQYAAAAAAEVNRRRQC
jgi:hypothetical protein